MAYCSKHRYSPDANCSSCKKAKAVCPHGDLPKYCDLCRGKKPSEAEQVEEASSPMEAKPMGLKPFPFNIHSWDEDISQKELERVRLYHWKYNKDPYFRNVVRIIADFKRLWSLMVKQAEGWDIPKPKPTAPKADPNCPKCHGYGGYPVPSDNSMYKLKDGSSLFQSWEDCDCLKSEK